jgi:hypothetical protein
MMCGDAWVWCQTRAELVVQEISSSIGRIGDAIDRHITHNQDTLMRSLGERLRLTLRLGD